MVQRLCCIFDKRLPHCTVLLLSHVVKPAFASELLGFVSCYSNVHHKELLLICIFFQFTLKFYSGEMTLTAFSMVG